MTRKAGYPLGRTPWASGEAGIGVVDVRSALPPTAVCAPSLAPPAGVRCGARRSVVALCFFLPSQKLAVAQPRDPRKMASVQKYAKGRGLFV